MEIIVAFIVANPQITIAAVMLWTIIERRRNKQLFDDEIEIVDKYNKKTEVLVDTILKGVVGSAYTEICTKTSNITLECPKGNNCIYPSSELNQQKIIYRLILESVFHIDTKNNIMNLIKVNGFHGKTVGELKDYCHDTAESIYLNIISLVQSRCEIYCPEIVKFVGGNYSIEDSIEDFTKIVNASLKNDADKDKALKKLRKHSDLVPKIKKIFTAGK
jgi:hypothetical protein